MTKIYSIDIQVAMTAYVKARSKAHALELAQKHFSEVGAELPLGFVDDEIEITDDTINADLPRVSLSPAVTFKGPYDDATPELSFRN